MPQGNDDLLPLFRLEALDRLDRLDETFSEGWPEPESEQWKLARREFHTLKGAGRMMGLAEIAETCHQAEDALEQPADEGFRTVLELTERVRTLVENVGGESDISGSEPAKTTTPVLGLTLPATQPSIDTRVLESVSDQAVRLGFLSQEVDALVDALHSMARTAESGVNDGQSEQVLATLALRLRRLALGAGQAHSRFDSLLSGQLASLISIQVQPVRPLLGSLGRHAVELGRSLGKTVVTQVESAHCRLDRRTMDALREALLHLVRNAVDHGIEEESERVLLGKSPEGSIVLRAEARAERVRLIVSDDGRGVDPRVVLDKAVRQGLVSEEAADGLSDEAIRQLLFCSGFSTRDQATEVSGRGIGLDTVADAVRKVGGDVWIESVRGEGAKITLDLPVSRRGEGILVVEAGGYRLGIPVHQVRAFSVSQPVEGLADGGASSGSADIRVDLVERLCLPPATGTPTIIHVKSVGIAFDLVVDRVVSEEEVFLHPWPHFLGRVQGSEALALLPDGMPIAVLDLQHFLQPANAELQALAAPVGHLPPLQVLLVDDSRITREMFRRILTDGGLKVMSVDSGEQALGVLDTEKVECIVTDIEMPGIDGLELTRRVRDNPIWEHLPVIVVSTRDQPSDRLAGLEVGADAYMAKQNLMGEDLVALVRRLGGR